MKRTLLLLAATAALSACSSLPDEVFTGSRDCGYIGCENGGLRVNNHEQLSNLNVGMVGIGARVTLHMHLVLQSMNKP